MIFSTFPRIAHLPGSCSTPEDVLLDDVGARPFLEEDVLVFEKLDGLNLTLRRVGRERLAAALKPEWSGVLDGDVERAIDIWLRQHAPRLLAALGPKDTLYGEWLWHRVSQRYDRLPAVLVGISWQTKGRILPFHLAARRLQRAGVVIVEPVFRGRLGSLGKLRSLIGPSRFGGARMEGVIVERLGTRWPRWAKYVDEGYAHPTTGLLDGARNALAR